MTGSRLIERRGEAKTDANAQSHCPDGYDRHWVNRNMPSLRKRFDETGGAQMTPCPPASSRARDRYEEI